MRGRLGLLAGCSAVLCAVAPAHAQTPVEDAVEALDGPKAWISIDDRIGVGAHRVVFDASRIATGMQVTAIVSADRRELKISAPGVHILPRSALCTGGKGIAKCEGIELDGVEAVLGAGADTWNASVPSGPYFLDRVEGRDGDDVLNGSTSLSLLMGDAGADRLVLRGPAESGSAHGGPGDDHLSAREGGHLTGDDGDDRVIGGPEGNHLTGGAGDDVLIGGDARDAVYAHEGADRIEGRGGNDMLSGGGGSDEVLGGTGTDTVLMGADAPIEVTLGDGLRNDGAPGENDLLESVENVSGYGFWTQKEGADRIVGDDGPNHLSGAAGADGRIEGLGGDDSLAYGRNLLGGDGDDSLLAAPFGQGFADGGAGDDTFPAFEAGRSCDPRTGGCSDTFSTVRIVAGPGDDVVDAQIPRFEGEVIADQQPDDVGCGDGWDEVAADAEDTVALDCEVVRRP